MANQNNADLSDQIYDFLTESGEERACDAISDDSCNEVPGNYLLNAVNGFSSKLAEQLASPELVIPWVFSLLGVSAFFSGLLVPLKNAGSLVPQLFISAKIRAFPIRKYFWGIAALVQAAMMFAIAWVINTTLADQAGWMIVLALFIFSVASGVASIAFKDVMGKTIPKGRRGKLLALRATGGGMLTIGAGLIFYFVVSGSSDTTIYSWLFVAAGVLWLIASGLFFLISEEKGATEGGRTPISELKQGWKLLKEDGNFVRFLSARGLLLSIPLVQPFLILYAQEKIGISITGLGLFVVVTGISNTISSPIWGRFADKSSKNLMSFSAFFAALVCGYVIGYDFLPEEWQNIYTYSPVFFLIIMAYGGARMARKTYLVDYAPSEERPLYVSVANTSIGILVLISGALGVIATYFGIQVMVAVLAGLMITAGIVSFQLKEA